MSFNSCVKGIKSAVSIERVDHCILLCVKMRGIPKKKYLGLMKGKGTFKCRFKRFYYLKMREDYQGERRRKKILNNFCKAKTFIRKYLAYSKNAERI